MEDNPYELYSDHPLLVEAYAAINAAMAAAKAKVQASDCPSKQYVIKVWSEVVAPVLDRYHKAGAADTEPRYLTKDALLRQCRGDD